MIHLSNEIKSCIYEYIPINIVRELTNNQGIINHVINSQKPYAFKTLQHKFIPIWKKKTETKQYYIRKILSVFKTPREIEEGIYSLFWRVCTPDYYSVLLKVHYYMLDKDDDYVYTRRDLKSIITDVKLEQLKYILHIFKSRAEQIT